MRILSMVVENFGSYKELHLEFTYDQTGLTLIQGSTGAGKSTLCDMIPWGLYGKTAKGGSVDEIRSWNSDEPTKVTIRLDKGTVSRVRGKVKDNDLMFWPNDGLVTRGKDITDTQKLINAWLVADYELYLASAYYHEFTQTAQFFTTTAKNRRQICEQLVDLSLAIRLKENVKSREKDLYQDITVISNEITALTSNVSLLNRLQETEKNKAKNWEKDKSNRLLEAEKHYKDFESNRKKIISKKCNSCGTTLQKPKEIIDESSNPWLDVLERVGTEHNPHSETTKDFTNEINEKLNNINVLKEQVSKNVSDSSDLEDLSAVIDVYRSTRISNTISFIETKTNQLLTDFFDSEIRVKFEVESADKLEVTIHKDMNAPSFTQLSKGQRQLLKLCFGLAVMQTVQNHHNIDINQVFIDEALDGLDDNMKLKALKMLENQSHSKSTYLVEHSESLKAMVDNKYSVELVNGESRLAKTQ